MCVCVCVCVYAHSLGTNHLKLAGPAKPRAAHHPQLRGRGLRKSHRGGAGIYI